jgi:prepilin-type N-terminal cleavage/methylation domain-containing protein
VKNSEQIDMEFISKVQRKIRTQQGFSLPELVIVVLIISIIAVFTLPQIVAARRSLRFSGLQRQISTGLRDARQEAISQRTAITFRYDNVNKRSITFGGRFGLFGTPSNQIASFTDEGLNQGEVIYGKPPGAPATGLGDGSNIEALSGGKADVTFEADGSIVDVSNVPQNKALFFYDTNNPTGLAFAVSVLGAGGRVKIWRFAAGTNTYVE